MKKENLYFCIINKENHYSIPWGSVSQGADNSVYFFLPSKEKGAHISLHPTEFHYKDNNETIVISRDKIINTEEMKESLKELSKIPYHQKSYIKDLILIMIKIVNYNGCENTYCKNKYGASFNYNILRYDLVNYLNKDINKTIKILGKPQEGLQYEDEEIDENVNEYNNLIEHKFDISSLKNIQKCNLCIDYSHIYYKKGKFHFFDCPECSGIKIKLDSLEKYKVIF